ncbi:sugar phosphate isomerase/epimerase family protein [Paraburkholderia sp. RL18-085-BIA-A]|uniref:sugar phosphate isomerase/epimerase family protein n=1 Tax=Paraburkholderia sp. RL18-085-BIA-A TaxID=3031633 RepID=UPI0038B938F3
MRISISNIAWDHSEDESLAELFARYGVDAIDIAPTKYFLDPASAGAGEIARVKDAWSRRGIEVIGMQSLLFGTVGLNLFGSAESREAMLAHLRAICHVGQGLGATRLVFGSPKNRNRGDLDNDAALDIAVPFFRRLGEIAGESSMIICLEPNPTCYDSNFMTTSKETLDVVRQVDHAAIRMQLDTGAMTINAEALEETVRECASAIGHVHASEPALIPVGDGPCDHATIASSIRESLPEQIVTIEMVATKDESHHTSIERALRKTIACYGDTSAEASQ